MTLAATSGQGEASVAFSVAANPTAVARSSAINVASTRVAVNQSPAPCRFGLSRNADAIAAAGGRLSVDVSTLTGCTWSATSNAGWIAIQSGQNGSGNGTVVLSIAANSAADRSGQVVIAGITYTVAQQAAPATPGTPAPNPGPSPAPPCAPTISPPSVTMGPAGGNVTVHVDADSACSWTATPTVDWIRVATSSTAGTRDVQVSVAANPSTNPRTGTVRIAAQTFTVTQDGAAPPPPPPPPSPTQISGSVSSIAGRCPNLSFRIGHTDVVTDASTTFAGFSCGELKNKNKVIVTGMPQPDASVRAIQVERQGKD